MKRTALLACLVLPHLAAIAARPFTTDDARVTTAGSCQLESWVRTYRDAHEVWFLPACNPTGNLEVTFGGGRSETRGAQATNDYVLQLKTLFKPLEANGWGWGLAIGKIHHPHALPGPNQMGNTYAYVPMSLSLDGANRAVLHANIGWLRDRASGRNNLTWGVGGELLAISRLSLIAETFGDNRARPFLQAGARLAIVPDRVQIDATVGQQLSAGRGGRWLSFGLRLTPESIF